MGSECSFLLNRTIGTDMEYGLELLEDGKTLGTEDSDDVTSWFLSFHPSRGKTTFLVNGGKLHEDMKHPEYSTPECTTPAEATLEHYRADRILTMLQKRHAKKGRVFRTYRDSMDTKGTSYGCHENYLMLRSVQWNDLRQNLIPFLVSRSLLFGAGMLWEDESYTYSARAAGVNVLEATTTTEGHRAVLGSRDESHLEGQLNIKYRRLHLTSGDANVCEWATFNKLSITALVLSMVEAGVGFSYLYPTDPIAAMKQLNTGSLNPERIETTSGKKVTAWEIQRYYCDEAEHFLKWAAQFQKVPGWMIKTHSRWDKLLTDLRFSGPDDWTESTKRIDWWAKWHLISIWKQHNPKADREELLAYCMDYHTTRPDESLAYSMVRSGFLERYLSDRQLEETTNKPPRHVRARERGEMVKRMLAGDSHISYIGWASAQVDGRGVIFSFPEP